MAYETVLYEKRDQIAHITLNRPEKLNSYNTQMIHELEEVWQDVASDADIRVAVLTGKGRAFCAGLDVKDTKLVNSDYADISNFTPRRAGVFKPVICAINGVCAGGGLRFLIESDLPICSEDASFIDPHVSMGFPGEREIIGLSRRIGFNWALRMGLFGRHERITAQRAYELTMVTEVLPQDQLLPRAIEMAETIRLNAPLALQGTVELMWRSLNMGMQDAINMSLYVTKWSQLTEGLSGGAQGLRGEAPAPVEGPLTRFPLSRTVVRASHRDGTPLLSRWLCVTQMAGQLFLVPFPLRRADICAPSLLSSPQPHDRALTASARS